MKQFIILLLWAFLISCENVPVVTSDIEYVIDNNSFYITDEHDSKGDVTITFKLRNTCSKKLFLPMYNDSSSLFSSFIEVNYNNVSVMASSRIKAGNQETNIINIGDSAFIDVRLSQEDLYKLKLKDSTLEASVKAMSFKYKRNETDAIKENYTIPEICFNTDKDFKYFWINKAGRFSH
ncbi:MAG: hypothetical protein IJ562_05180 [Prevotella sp.]|nr:hypothetical protein [Prevotella sp.]